MGNKTRLVVCTDDIRPETVKKYWNFWHSLKLKHPGLKLNAFVIPHYFETDSEYILNKEFVEWYGSVKGWVDLHLHGYAHSFPPECLLSEETQEKLIEKGAQLLGKLCGGDFGFKAPGYHYTEATGKILQKYCIKFLCNKEEIIWTRPVKIDESLLPVNLVQTHTNGISVDSVNLIYNELDGFFKDKDFIFINDLTL